MPRQSFGNGRICVDVGLTNHADNQEVVETAVCVPVKYCVAAHGVVNVKHQLL